MARSHSLLRQVLTAQYFAVLNTVGEGSPHSNLVSFAVTDDLRSLVFVTRRDTRKYTNMQENHGVSLLVDNRSNKPEDISEATAIEVVGTAREDTDSSSDLKAFLIDRHPQIRRFVEAAETAIMVVRVKEYIISGFDETERVVMSE
ncbi:MAG: pyridoxamine 5'-phosphate oxidase family protein [Dehalococcoidia bacterium]